MKQLKAQIKALLLRRFCNEPPRHRDRVCVSGWPATGSTFVFQVLKDLGLQVVKTHGFPAGEGYTLNLFTIRDPRDVMVSRARRWGGLDVSGAKIEQLLEKAMRTFDEEYRASYEQALSAPRTIIVRYETFIIANQAVFVQFAADQFGVPVTEERIREVLGHASLDSNARRAEALNDFRDYDKETYVHGRHVTNRGRIGGWRQCFPPAIHKAVAENWGEFLVRLGYEAASSGAPPS